MLQRIICTPVDAPRRPKQGNNNDLYRQSPDFGGFRRFDQHGAVQRCPDLKLRFSPKREQRPVP
jgi:hypothetical protein